MIASRRWFRSSGRAPANRVVAVATCFAWIFLCAPPARSHTYDEQRRLLVSVTSEGVECLVVWELPGGIEAGMLRGMFDLNHDGTVEGDGLELLLQTQMLGPRVMRGLTVEWNGETMRLRPDDLAFRDGGGDGGQRGFVAMLLLDARWPSSSGNPGDEATIEVTLAPNTPETQLELQVSGGVALADTPVPPAADAPVVGPIHLVPEVPSRFRVVVSNE